MVTIIGVGSSTITASQASTASYTSGTITASLIVNKGTPTITFSIPAKTVGDSPFILAPTSNSTGAFTYTSRNMGTGLFVAVGQGANTIATSTDGITWTGRTANGGLTNQVNCVAYANSLWVAVGNGSGKSIVTSVDGITWTSRAANGGITIGYAVAYGNGLWVSVGDGGGKIATSTRRVSSALLVCTATPL